MMSHALLAQRCGEAAALLLTAADPQQLAQAICQQAGSPLILEDHAWLRQAAEYFSAGLAQESQFAGEMEPVPPAAVDTAVVVGLGAIPETGSVLVAGRTLSTWRLSLCPRRLVVVIPAAQAALSLAEALAVTAQDSSGLVSWLTGPSRTADIEKVLVLGAQGARDLTVILYTAGEVSA